MDAFLAIVSFIEKPDNFALIEGKAAKNKPVISGQKLTKSAGYQALAAERMRAVSKLHAGGWENCFEI